MKQTNRRVFMMQVALGGTALAAQQALAQAMVNEKDPQAAALGYAADTTKVDAKKFPKHAAAQKCNNCALYQGKATDPAGGCPLFAGKQVHGNGWCSAWAKKAKAISECAFSMTTPNLSKCTVKASKTFA
jgi:hypothetical protein